MWNIDLSGKTIIVSGGNRGIGQAISHQCAQAGAHVAILYRSSEDAPEIAKGIAEKYDVRCQAFKCDVSDQKQIHDLVRQIYHDLGPVGGMICNAGVLVSKPAMEMTKEDFDEQFHTNVWGVFNCAQAAASLWKEHDYKDGRIVFVSSVAATIVNRDGNACFYSPTKGALSMLSKSLAVEWADQGILVNNISPGFVDTDMNASITQDADKKKEVESRIPLKRFSNPDEQAGMAVFLLSEYATYATGTEMILDGGEHIW
ncbi:hypothetical protein P7C73_g4456, partial [Tremellales sp. Uapishka_1]